MLLRTVFLSVIVGGGLPLMGFGSEFTPRLTSAQGVRGDNTEPHWVFKLGLRSHLVDQAFPLIDRVVLVPDAATYVDELSRWSPAGRWPVLIEDAELAPMFIRRFSPAEVIRRESIGETERTPEAWRELVEHTPIRAWGGNPQQHTLRDIFAAHNYVPPGAVIASLNDPAWTAAVALAAGRGQPLLWLDGRFGSPNAMVEQAEARVLADRIESLLEAQGIPWRTVGEGIDTLTICREMPGRVGLPRWDNGAKEPAAMTDYLGRLPSGERYAVTGWIFGDEVRSAYIAMCSLFLPRTNVWLVNTYPATREWEAYSTSNAAAIFAEQGFEVREIVGSAASESGWLNLLPGGVDADVFMMNTKGTAETFDLFAGAAHATDVPTLNVPAAVHFIHSWSFRSPESVDTIAGAWLARGVYAYVGSVHEPFLPAFVPPVELAKRWLSAAPFLVGARQIDAPPPFGGPWRVNTFGDPLMLIPPPVRTNGNGGTNHAADPRGKARLAQPATYGENLLHRVRDLMRAMADDPSGKTHAEVISLLNLLGRDEIALQVWRLAEQNGAAAAAAQPALAPLFRAQDVDGFLRAWDLMNRHSAREITMLWHLMTPRLRGVRDEDVLLILQSAIRREMPHVDAGRLAPHLSRIAGKPRARNMILRELERTRNEGVQRRLRELLSEY